jgi:DNA-binding winged helix-turn-helix (wHTH) protein
MTPGNGIAPEIDPVVCFGEFRLDLSLRSLHRGPETVKVTPKPFATLAFLVDNRQRVVSKAELLERIWGGARDISTVEHAIGKLRRALGDDAEEARYVQTVPGQGYRFVAEVQPVVVKSALVVGDVPVHRRASRTIWMAVAALACLSVLGAAIAYIVIPVRVARGAWNGNTFVAVSDSGRVLWKYPFDAPLRELPADESLWRTQIVDLDGDGVPEILVAASFAPPQRAGHDEIFCFSSRGKVLWRYKPKEEIEFRTRDLNGPWKFVQMLVLPNGRSSSIWVSVAHNLWWPSFVVRLSAVGVASRVFTSSGDVMALQQVQTNAGSFVLAAGVNNEYRQASLAILSENGLPSTSPQTKGSGFQCIRGCPAANPYRYILLPRSELNAASDGPYNLATHIYTRPSGITVETHEEDPGGTAFYDFSQELHPERVAYGGGYREIHQRSEREGRIHHSFKDCPERKSPAILRICDDHGNWSTVAVPRVAMPD